MPESKEMREIHKIRLKIHEETKDLSPAEHTKYYRKAAEEIAAKHGIVLLRPESRI